ncbi:hypothetical protein HELRODRAFT_179031 [Helobdella robusta]|uniref:Uncharacterized protein n=1 Tax=Helobdella robusta TaxID=6412 RepID=T1FE29_HELRO|nr:hypothetical protein HELRODRAFT_179031 [Helobdella robusta]ESN95841.1 hypothetical protein HELRODRAFT_179031 [Helobdella robusta]
MYIFNQSTCHVTGVVNVDWLLVLLSSLVDGITKLLGVPRFREKWTEMNHTPEARSTPLIIVSDAIKAFIKCQLEVRHSRDDYFEFLLLAAQIAELQVNVAIRKPGARHRARWMAKAIYALKIELLFTVNKTIFNLNSLRITRYSTFESVYHLCLSSVMVFMQAHC